MEERKLKKKIKTMKLRISLLERLEEWLQKRLSRIQTKKAGYEEEKEVVAAELEELLCPKQPLLGKKMVAKEFLESGEYGFQKFVEELNSLPGGIRKSFEVYLKTPQMIRRDSSNRIEESNPEKTPQEIAGDITTCSLWEAIKKMAKEISNGKVHQVESDAPVYVYWWDFFVANKDNTKMQMLASVGDKDPEYYVVDVKYSETDRTKEGFPIVEEIKSRDFHFKFETSKKLSQEAKNQKIYSSITKGEQIAYCETVYKSLLDIEVAYVDPRILLGITEEQYYKRYGSKEWQDAWCDALGKRFGSEKDHLKVTLASSKADGEGAMDIYRIEMVGSRGVSSESAA